MTHLILIACSFLTQVPSQESSSSSPKVHKIAVGGEGGWDYLTVDPGARRLYVSRGNRVVVLDLEKETVVGELADTPGVHGIAIVPELGKGFTSNGSDSSVTVFDLKTLKATGRSRPVASPTRSSTTRPASGSSPSTTAPTTGPRSTRPRRRSSARSPSGASPRRPSPTARGTSSSTSGARARSPSSTPSR